MITRIIKRDGRSIPYNEEKICNAIFAAAKAVEAKYGHDASLEQARFLAHEVTETLNTIYEDNPTVEQIQDQVVKTLIKNNLAEISVEYILYREERTKRRNLETPLIQSIKKITDLDAIEVDAKRENGNVDGNTSMGMMLQYGSTISREYCSNYILKPEFAKAHANGDIHIHDLDFMNMGTMTCCQIDLDPLFENGFSTGHGFLRSPQDIQSYAALACIVIQSDQNDQHGGQSLPLFDYNLAKGVRKTFARVYKENMTKALSVFDIDIDRKEFMKDETPSIEDNTEYMAKELEFLKTLSIPVDVEHLQKKINEQSIKDTERKTFQAMEALIHNLNTMHSRAGAQVPFSNINMGTDTSVAGRMVCRNLMLAEEAGLGNGETPIFPIVIFKVKEGVNYNPEDPNYDLFKLAIKVSAKRLFPNFSFLDAPFNAQYYIPGRPESEATYMGCRTRVVGNVCDESTVTGRGNCSFTSINLVSLGIKHGLIKTGTSDIDGFFKDLDHYLELCCNQLLQRYEIQCSKKVKNFPFLMGQGLWRGSELLGPEDDLSSVVKQGTLTVGFIGLAECLKALIGKHHGESAEAQELGIKIVKHMREFLDEKTKKYTLNFSLIATPAEGLSGRFTKIDKVRYGILPGITDKDYYTNSFHIPVYQKISAFKKIELEAPYHAFTNAGHISYIELDGDPTNNLDGFEQVIRCMKESGIGYGSINHPVDRDPICGYTGIIEGHICPNCGRDETHSQIKFERIRRITGYLVGTLDRFNNAKRAEEHDRVKHGLCK